MAKRPKPTNEQIIAVIAGIDNVPAALGVSRALSAEGLSYSNTSVRSRIEANPLIGEAMEKRGRAYLEGLSDPELFRRVNNMGWKSRLPAYASELVDERVDAKLLVVIAGIDNVPAALGVSRALSAEGLSYSNTSVQKRIAATQKIEEAMRARGKEYLSGLSEADLFGRTSSRGWMSHLLMYAQELVYQRVDASILRAIEGMNDVPTASAIPRKLEENGLPYSFNAVQKRINENIELWCAYYTKKGLTEDQALSLAVERQRGSPALKESIERRLEHLSVFLEALAILQFRGLLFKNAPWLLELSYYPAVIAHAQAFTGKPIESDWFDIRDVAINGEGGIHYADQSVPCAVLLSAVHRLKSADLLGRVFSELGRVLMLSGRLALTFPADYELHELFYEQVARAGFSQVESGERETSASLGLATTGSSARSAEDQRRLARKVSGKSTVVLLEKTAPSEPTNGLLVEPLIKGESVGAGDSMQHPQYEAIDVPTEVTNGLYHTYSARLPAAVADNALLVTVVDDKDGNSVDLFGYDMNPHERDTIEHGCYDRHGGLSAMDADSLKEAILRRVREGTSAPNPLHIHPLRDTRVSARLVRSVLPTKI